MRALPAAFAAVVVLAGCGGDEEPEPRRTTTSGAAATRSAPTPAEPPAAFAGVASQACAAVAKPFVALSARDLTGEETLATLERGETAARRQQARVSDAAQGTPAAEPFLEALRGIGESFAGVGDAVDAGTTGDGRRATRQLIRAFRELERAAADLDVAGCEVV